jgi:hypothetical protein
MLNQGWEESEEPGRARESARQRKRLKSWRRFYQSLLCNPAAACAATSAAELAVVADQAVIEMDRRENYGIPPGQKKEN